MTTKEYERQLKLAKLYRLDKEQKEVIKEIRHGEKKKIQTSKVFFVLVYLTCTAVIVYSMYAMLALGDLSSLPTLIGSTVVEGVSLGAYFAKAYFETKSEKNLEFEKEKFYVNTDSDGSVG